MKLQFKKKKVFGKWRLYPACESAELLLSLMGRSNETRKCLPMDMIDSVKRLGFEVEVQE